MPWSFEVLTFIQSTPHPRAEATIDNIAGRIVIAREPSTILLAALHFTHSCFMDMDSVFRALGSHEPAVACTSKSIASNHATQFVFSLSYYTVIGDDCEPKEWQPHDEDLHAVTEVRLSRCNTVVALTLFNEKAQEPGIGQSHSTGGKTKLKIPPWHILNLQCFPDWRATFDVFENDHKIIHGGDAFLTAILTEFQDAVKRFEGIQEAIARLVIPSQDFIFKESLRDERLFDDASFVWTKQYFWALHVLPRIIKSSEEMEGEIYNIRNSKNDWSNYISEAWPDLPVLEKSPARLRSPTDVRFRRLMSGFKDVEQKLGSVRVRSQELCPQIQSLQSTLFNGTSVLESRKTVQQGENVKLLTIVNVFFLPLTFITSVFGMTNMPDDANFVRFGTVLVAVCLPLFGFIGLASSQHGYSYMKTTSRRVWEWTKTNVTVQKKEERSLDPLQRRRRYGFSRRDTPSDDLEAPITSFSEAEKGSSNNGGNEGVRFRTHQIDR
ncbi:hypothetical protein DPSP01_001078 [Paraphaeosphaeria sporulosa]